MRALNNVYSDQAGWAPIAVAATKTSAAIDFANCIENRIVIYPGLWTDGTHTFSMTESGDGTNFTAVAAGNQLGSFSVVSSTATAVIQDVAYIGQYRYVKVIDTVTSATTGAIFGVVAQVKYRKMTSGT